MAFSYPSHRAYHSGKIEGNQKLAAIGIKVTRWIAYHGLALNVTTDMTPFQRIVPCGIQDRRVGSIKGLLKENIPYKGCEEENNHHTDEYKLIDIAYKSLIWEFCKVFQVDLRHKVMQIGVSHGKTVDLTC